MTKVNIDVNKVASVYSGLHGCCCGCRGKHTYASGHRQWATSHRGYTVDDGEVNDKTVRRHVKTIQRWFDETPEVVIEKMIEDQRVFVTEDFVSFDTDTRTYVAYLVNNEGQ